MKHTLDTLYCPECGGTNVRVMAWVGRKHEKISFYHKHAR